MLKLFRGVAAAVGVLALTLAGAWPAHGATGTGWTSTAVITSSPDDGCPAWARDTFTRTTTITSLGEGKFRVTIGDVGTFTTNPKAAGIKGTAAGKLTGSGEFTVTGDLRNQAALKALNGKTFSLAGHACKKDVPSDKTTGNWPKQFFKAGAQVSGINPWKWTYSTPCELKVESSVSSENSGAITGKTCPAVISTVPAACADMRATVNVFNPNSHARLNVRFGGGPTWHVKPGASQIHRFGSGSVQVRVNGVNQGVPYRYVAPTGCATASPTAGATATVKPTAAVSPTATGKPTPTQGGGVAPSLSPAAGEPSDDDGGALPVTGAGVAGMALAGVLALSAGAAAFLVARRRRTRFTA